MDSSSLLSFHLLISRREYNATPDYKGKGLKAQKCEIEKGDHCITTTRVRKSGSPVGWRGSAWEDGQPGPTRATDTRIKPMTTRGQQEFPSGLGHPWAEKEASSAFEVLASCRLEKRNVTQSCPKQH